MRATTLASITVSGWTVEGLGARGNFSEVPELGGVKADRGSFGSDFGPLRLPPGGEGGTLMLISGGELVAKGV